jgi:hypothetical protein
MATTRERFYQCTFTSGGQRRTEYVRAWSATDAKRTFAEILASEGIEPAGQIEAVLAGPRTASTAVVPGLPQVSHA